MNMSILEKGPDWLAHASETSLREFVRALDTLDPSTEKYARLKAMLDKECKRRTEENYERIDRGEWI